MNQIVLLPHIRGSLSRGYKKRGRGLDVKSHSHRIWSGKITGFEHSKFLKIFQGFGFQKMCKTVVGIQD